MTRRPMRLALASMLVGLVIVSGGVASVPARGHAAALPKATLIMNWFPEPEHGGFYAAVQQGFYHKYGVDITIKTFNPQSGNCESLVVTGRVDFCMDIADALLLARQQGIPVVGVMTTMQISPQGILWHAEDKTMHGVADLSNHTFIYSFGSAYWEFMKNKYHYTNVKTQATDYTLRAFFTNPKAVTQCYVTSEPYIAMHSGHKVKWALIAESGYNPYAQVMLTSESMIKNHPEVVRAFVRGSIDGWKSFFAKPAPVFSYLRSVPGAASYPLTLGAMQFSFAQLKPLVLGGAAKTHGLGYTNGAGLTLPKKQMTSVGLKLNKVDPSKAYTNQFLPAGSGM